MFLIPAVASGLLAMVIIGNSVALADYPEKPIRMVVGFPPGSQPDTIARLLGQKLAESWGKPVMIKNVTGGGSTIAADRVAKAPPDGYTLGLLGQAPLILGPNLKKLPYDPVKDFVPVSQITVSLTGMLLVVHPVVPAKNVKELVALAKGQPGALTFASGGVGSGTHLATELFKSMAGLDLRHIPYKGLPEAIPDLVSGRVTMAFSPSADCLSAVRAGRLRALAVTAKSRSPAFPDLPAISESGYPGFEFSGWTGLFAPTTTPEGIIAKLHIETVKALAQPDVRAKFADLGLAGTGIPPDAFATLIRAEIPKWAKLIKRAGIKVDKRP